MANKSGDNSLRDWFGKSKSSDGTPGWVQLGGKYAGKPCAKQPGQKTKPKCGSSKMKRNLNKKEEQKAFRRKNAKDPNPNRKGKAINVATEETTTSLFRRLLDEKKKCWKGYKKVGTQKLFGKTYNRCVKAEELNIEQSVIVGTPKPGGADRWSKMSTDAKMEYAANKAANQAKGIAARLADAKKAAKNVKTTSGSVNIRADVPEDFEYQGVLMTEEQFDEAAGEKDACYHKVKSRYSVWPSAYASGALVKCRKVGAKNWGNKTKKEGYEFSNWRDDFQATEYESIDIIKAEPLQPSQPVIDEAGKKCWKGYKKAGTQKLFGKTYNRCVKAHFSDWRADMELQEAIPGYDKYNDAVAAAKKLSGRKKIDALKAAAKLRPATEKEVNQKIGESVKPDKKLPLKKLGPTRRPFPQPGDKRPERPPGPGHEEPLPPWDDPLAKLKSNRKSVKEDWQKSNRNDGVDGMSQKSVNAYKRENPGSKLQTAVTGNPKKGSKDAKRRKSFCSRSKGQKDMHNIDCSKTPDKKICKARKRWRCR